MRRIRIQNPPVDKTYKAFVSSDYSSGVSLTVLNNVSFAANDLAVIGEPSEELTELKKLDGISGTTILTLASALSFSHPKGTPVYKVLWDNVSIEGRSSSSGTFAEITQSAIQWDNKLNETVYYHDSGDDNWEYRFRFYDSVDTRYSEYSPTITGAGFSRQQVGRMINNVRLVVNDLKRKVVTDDIIIRAFNRAQDIVYARNPRYWFLLVDTYKGANGISATADTSVYSLATYTTLGHIHSVRYRYTSGSTDNLYQLRKISDAIFDNLFSDLNQAKDDWTQAYKLLPADSSSSQGYIQIYPTTKNNSVGTLYPNYYEKMANLDSVDDKTQVPLPNLLEDYAIAHVERIKGNDTKAKIFENLFYGPADTEKKSKKLNGLALLDQMDRQQKEAQGQPRSLWKFKGQRAMRRYYGKPRFRDRDAIKENYF